MTTQTYDCKRPGSALARPRKKSKLRDPENYAKGAVIKIRLHDFMTYKDAEITPGPRLNLVLGPNGTGKSSLVCALCVGLAGNQKLLGRADSVADFVRRGKQEGWVEITLSSGPRSPPIVVRRTITTDNKSTWKLGREVVSKKDVIKKMEDLNVQLDNLCQFLPQDKVVKFAELKPTELLEETEKAIGDARLYELHQELIKKRNDLKDKEKAKEALERDLVNLQAQNQAVHRDVQRYQEKEKLQEQVKLLEMKLSHLKEKQLKREIEQAKSAVDAGIRKLKEKEKELRNSEQPLDEKKEELNRAHSHFDALNNKARLAEQKLLGSQSGQYVSLDEQLSDMHTSIEQKYSELAGLEDEAKRLANEIRKAEDEISRIQDHIDRLEDLPADIDTQLTALRHQEHDLNTKIITLRYAIDGIRQSMADTVDMDIHRTQASLKKLDDVKHQRLQQLEQRFPGTRAAFQYVQQNKQRYRDVYGPIGLEINVTNPKHAQILENHCPGHIWSMFVVTTVEDQKQLIRDVHQATGRKPTVTCCRAVTPGPPSHPDGEPEEYARWGIEATLDQVFTAPPIIKQVMCNEAGVNRAYIGDRRMEDNQVAGNFLDKNNKVSVLYTPTDQYRVKKSSYADVRSTSSSALRPARVFGGQTDSSGDERRKLEAELEGKQKEKRHMSEDLNEKCKELEQLEAQFAACQREKVHKEKLKRDHKDKKSALTGKLANRQHHLEMKKRQPDPRDDAPNIKKEIDDLNNQALQLVHKVRDLYTDFWEATRKMTVAKLVWKEKEMQVHAIQQLTKDAKAEVHRLKTQKQQLERIYEHARTAWERYRRAEQGFTVNAELKQKFAELPNDPDEIQVMMDTKSAEADGIMCSNPGVVEEYKRRLADIRDKEKKLKHETETVELMQAEITRLKDEWLPELNEIVSLISHTFTQNFSRIGCAGEVNLQQADDFDKYAIEIKVKFRENEQLEVLTANRQSGGERSVSTMLYLISIQGVTVTPFRVVDEINQGMDPINERKVFAQLVESACKDGTPQCFLLTPKLLPDLKFSEHVSVLQIMNGPFISDVSTNFKMAELHGLRAPMAIESAA